MRTWTKERTGGGRRAMWVGLATLGVLAGAPANVDAQAVDEREPQVGCFRGRPLPACRSFWIVEMQGNFPVIQTERAAPQGSGTELLGDALEETLEWNLGHMINVTPTFAVGGVLTVGTGNDNALRGLKLRGRRWLSDDVSLELEAGAMRSSAGGTRYPGVTGPTADLRINVRDQGSFFVRWEGLDLPAAGDPSSPVFYDPGGPVQGLSVGASLGSLPAVVGTGALGLTWAVLVALFLAGD